MDRLMNPEDLEDVKESIIAARWPLAITFAIAVYGYSGAYSKYLDEQNVVRSAPRTEISQISERTAADSNDVIHIPSQE